jgi:hypothetical protein
MPFWRTFLGWNWRPLGLKLTKFKSCKDGSQFFTVTVPLVLPKGKKQVFDWVVFCFVFNSVEAIIGINISTLVWHQLKTCRINFDHLKLYKRHLDWCWLSALVELFFTLKLRCLLCLLSWIITSSSILISINISTIIVIKI